ncbi:putative thioredoxin [Neospora caninum Liverpool]|uniref:Putative thioredoxin n=1 Tax=Neospora caninum (strain Liverpool) TaxID=572307 RepID=F0VB45_NEOCL|nr:putative thioredoxin [Neospora caninum Liverpool]CBZ50867.1 putative thioredoxin [Neospora caninum Liverpool]CEL68169.1 TPA: thioredoxin, putative [Neospora caninum Liverpool]|eukprot:XP_003880900.1 putative thioredoxin [Neospora caninum Liverpool]
MICIGPVCVPIWQLGIVGAFLLNPLKNAAVYVYSRCCKRRAHCAETGAQGLRVANLELFRTTDTALKRTAGEYPSQAVSVHSDDQLAALKRRLSGGNKPQMIFVDFGATWCQPCKSMCPFFEALSVFYEGTFVKVDVDECPDSADDAAVQALPTLCVMAPSGGKWEVVARAVGANRRDWENLVATHSIPRHGDSPSNEKESTKDQ